MSEPYSFVVPIRKKYVVAFLFGSTFPLSVTVVGVTLDAPPVVTAGLAALAAAGATRPSASARIMTRRNIVPPVLICPYPRPVNTAHGRMSRRR